MVTGGAKEKYEGRFAAKDLYTPVTHFRVGGRRIGNAGLDGLQGTTDFGQEIDF